MIAHIYVDSLNKAQTIGGCNIYFHDTYINVKDDVS